jgi:hypothetical protein
MYMIDLKYINYSLSSKYDIREVKKIYSQCGIFSLHDWQNCLDPATQLFKARRHAPSVIQLTSVCASQHSGPWMDPGTGKGVLAHN